MIPEVKRPRKPLRVKLKRECRRIGHQLRDAAQLPLEVLSTRLYDHRFLGNLTVTDGAKSP